MAWTPPTQKAFEPGEIPGKKTISAEEQANLDKNRPEKDVAAMFGQTEMQTDKEKALSPTNTQTTILDEMLEENPENQIYADLLDEWKDEDPDNPFGHLAKVLEEDFIEQIGDRLSKAGKDYDEMEVSEVAYVRELRPFMFYFGMGIMENLVADDSVNQPRKMVVIITPIPEWEEHKSWNDQSLASYIRPDFLHDLMESMYGFDSDKMTASQVRKELTKLGFVEKHEVADLL